MKKILCFFILTGCYSPITDTQYKIDPIIQPYLDHFYSISESYGKSLNHSNLIISIEYGLAKQFQCDGLTTLRTNGGQRQIEFDQEFWNESTQEIREVLTLHEFGHAFLGRIHTTTFSIMNPKMGNKGWPDNNHKILLDELFK